MTLKTRTNTKLLSIKNCRLILENRILDDATIVIEDGILTSISTTGAAPDGAIDAYGCFVMAGLVDSHSDGLEKEISPRPTVRFDTTYALSSYESRVRSAGITTIAHGVGYQDNPKMGRSVEGAKELRQVILSRASNPNSLVSHKVLHRIEARDEAGVEALVQGLNSETGEMNWMVSFEDHTPGQGQYRDRKQFEAAVEKHELAPGMTVEEYVNKKIAEAEASFSQLEATRKKLRPFVESEKIKLIAHDLENRDEVQNAILEGAKVAEFPVTLDAAQCSVENGLAVVMGAPNALRGSSHSGNVSAREVISLGLCTALASDYMPSSLLASAFLMAETKVCSLVEAINLITKGPASMIGLEKEGTLRIGCSEDLLIVQSKGRWPQVVKVLRPNEPSLLV